MDNAFIFMQLIKRVNQTHHHANHCCHSPYTDTLNTCHTHAHIQAHTHTPAPPLPPYAWPATPSCPAPPSRKLGCGTLLLCAREHVVYQAQQTHQHAGTPVKHGRTSLCAFCAHTCVCVCARVRN
jgi:hypothetical protein